MLCPRDCGACRDPVCHAQACKLTGEPMLDACWACGEILTYSSRVVFCASCAAEPARRTRGGASAR